MRKPKKRINTKWLDWPKLVVAGTRCRVKVTFGRHWMYFQILFSFELFFLLVASLQFSPRALFRVQITGVRMSYFVFFPLRYRRKKKLHTRLTFPVSAFRLFLYFFIIYFSYPVFRLFFPIILKSNGQFIYSWMWDPDPFSVGTLRVVVGYKFTGAFGVRQVVVFLVLFHWQDIVCMYTRTLRVIVEHAAH